MKCLLPHHQPNEGDEELGTAVPVPESGDQMQKKTVVPITASPVKGVCAMEEGGLRDTVKS